MNVFLYLFFSFSSLTIFVRKIYYFLIKSVKKSEILTIFSTILSFGSFFYVFYNAAAVSSSFKKSLA
jgi:hypothetical protein